ncbi:UDP-4-amino-4,6-dideoxy-N-acetyl-beta-L-altrosamine transaminase [Thiomicrospira microaerophila]|uniref:UDP-4-amino-4, 6-dideoxy-N-acetyl-beta-L-altrosamine transaminase n=1 Tax=Thiomicrospira microaerophila TaxID=406020 RepID=UPI00200D23AA|nr:UDP-4-amino-4,6-dideoxy-N-acetyl-beta-L-altrosamine transaminase [Thiomicrospira microaerophila]UQB42703.1 UDP-4-amino-4,6-dideoxy-N-acetyl-beta-L-altrosamine transaminase [Thiomicrospira microaerophila]
MIPYGKQAISQADIDAVVAVLQSDYLTQGPQVPAFETAVKNYSGAQFGIAVNSATSVLHIACLALGLSEGDWLWTSPNTFVASANCARYCGADVDFVDIDPHTYNLCVEQLEQKLIQAQQQNRLPKIVIPVHFAGQSCDMRRIHQLSQQYGFKIIEDASHAIGGRYLDLPIGGCRYSDITIFSFHPVKIITTAEGGLATTNQPELAEKMQLLRSHGVTREAHLMDQALEGPWYYQQVDLGFNYRMTELQAALGLSQMSRLDEFVAKRHQLAQRYFAELANTDLVLPYQHPDSHSSLHLFPILLPASLNRAEVFNRLREQGLGVNVHYIPVHTQPYYRRLGFNAGDFPQAEAYYQRAISIPLHQGLTYEEQGYVIDCIRSLACVD